MSSLSFQYECSRIKLNILKLYGHLLGVLLSLFSSLLSLVNTRLISNKTKINDCLFPRGQVFFFGICLTRLTIPRSLNSFKR